VLLKENETVLSKLHELANQGDNSQVTQWAKSPKKLCIGLYFECQIIKNALLQTVVLAI